MTCPHCHDYDLQMYEHYEEYDDEILRQDQNYQCPNCHRTYSCTAWYRLFEEEWHFEEDK